MDTPIKIKESLVSRLDEKQRHFNLGTRQNLANTLIQKGLDFIDKNGYDALIKIPTSLKGKDALVQTSKQRS